MYRNDFCGITLCEAWLVSVRRSSKIQWSEKDADFWNLDITFIISKLKLVCFFSMRGILVNVQINNSDIHVHLIQFKSIYSWNWVKRGVFSEIDTNILTSGFNTTPKLKKWNNAQKWYFCITFCKAWLISVRKSSKI